MARSMAVLVLVSLLSLAAWCAGGAPGPQRPAIDASQGKPGPEHTPTAEETRQQKHMERDLAKQRYQQMRHDSEQLVLLSNQLKRYVDTAGENILSVDVLKKADEIEKLVRDNKNKMKGP